MWCHVAWAVVCGVMRLGRWCVVSRGLGGGVWCHEAWAVVCGVMLLG